MTEKFLVLDNGAYTIKAEFSGAEKPRLIPNCLSKAKHERKRIFIANQLDECKDKSGLYLQLPFEKGFLIKWDLEYQIWDHIFGPENFNVDYNSTSLILTEPYLNFPSIKDSMNEVIFEDYQFAAALRTNPGRLAAYKYHQDNPDQVACHVVDSGFSFSHTVPYIKQEPIKDSILRINMGGKVLTNHLKDIISYRQLQVMEEFYVMNQCKEDACFVSTNFNDDIKAAKEKGNSPFMRDYVLPDFMEIERGFLRNDGAAKKEDEQILRMNHERFAVPDLLFRPSDVGINQMGLAEATAHCILSTTQEDARSHLSKNILLIGGNAEFPGFRERFEMEVRSLLPDLYKVRVTCENPVIMPWLGGAALAKEPETLRKMMVTKKEYEEIGPDICDERFRI